MDAADEPLSHEYVFPPDAVSVAVCPEQIVAFKITGVGDGEIETVAVAVSLHPAGLETITEYVEAAVATAVMDAEVCPVLQK